MTDVQTPAAPDTPEPGVIDITNVVEGMQSTFVLLGVNFLFGAAIALPGMSWLAFPIISSVVKGVLNWGVSALASSVFMGAFFLNTAIRKGSQAGDFVAAMAFKDSLPEDVSDVDYEKAEQAQMLAFSNLIRVDR